MTATVMNVTVVLNVADVVAVRGKNRIINFDASPRWEPSKQESCLLLQERAILQADMLIRRHLGFDNQDGLAYRTSLFEAEKKASL